MGPWTIAVHFAPLVAFKQIDRLCLSDYTVSVEKRSCVCLSLPTEHFVHMTVQVLFLSFIVFMLF